jgi:hypothetical protein
MFSKNNLTKLFAVMLTMCLVCPLLAQKSVNKFKDVDIPFNMKHEDTVIEKGKYEFEVLKYPTQVIFYLSIKKKRGQNLCLIPGERLKYSNEEIEEGKIPKKSKLSFKRIPVRKQVYIIYEAGSKTAIFPLIKIRWILEYE